MKLLHALLAIVVLVLSGCAHQISISPDIAKIESVPNAVPIGKHVGYYVAPDIRERAVTTPGGGGDSVTYAPYRDLEAALYKMLGNVFQNVTLLMAPPSAEAIAKRSLDLIFTPEVVTESSSPSPFTWPPTRFSVKLLSSVTDAAGKSILKISVTGQGQAEFDEFKADFALSGKRAALDAVQKMQTELLQSRDLRM